MTIQESTRTAEGRVEVCINNAWGTVCRNLFGREDAETACFNIGGFTRQGIKTTVNFECGVLHLYVPWERGH